MLLVASCGAAHHTSEEAVSFNCSVDTLKFTCEGGTQSLEASCTKAGFQALCNDSWIRSIEPPYEATNKGTFAVTAQANSSTKARTTSITLKCGEVRTYIPVVQEGRPAEPVDESITIPDGYTLVWHDEFDGDAVNTSTNGWKFEDWPKGRVNHELQRYVSGGQLDGHKTAFIEDGALNIVAMKYNGEIISARMNTRKSWEYGWFEAAIWLPVGKGTWPAFWCMPNDQSLGWPACGEIDIMEEVGVDANQTSSSVHTKSFNHVMNTQKTASRYTRGAESGYHVYAMEWTADYIQTYVDGVKLLRFDNDGQGNDHWPFNKTFYITLNLAWGGDWGGYKGVDESALPCTMKVDYVRVFQK